MMRRAMRIGGRVRRSSEFKDSETGRFAVMRNYAAVLVSRGARATNAADGVCIDSQATSSINRSCEGGNGNGGPAWSPASRAMAAYSEAVNASPC